MRYRTIPGTSLTPSVICLGTMPLGTRLDQEQSNRLLDAFLDLGGSFIDTAHIYSDWESPVRSVSERTIGNWLRQSGKRNRIVLATKGAHHDLADKHSRLAPEDIRQDLDESLCFLQTDVIDLYWLHRDDPARPVQEILDVLEAERRKGKIRYYGCSNWRPDRMEQARRYAAAEGVPGFVADQPWWSLAMPNPEAVGDPTLVLMDEELLAYHRRTGMAVVPYTSQAKGFFSGKYGRGLRPANSPSAAEVERLFYNKVNLARLEKCQALARELGATANQVALAYLLHHDFPVFPIVGAHTLEQLRDSCGAADLSLSPEALRNLADGQAH